MKVYAIQNKEGKWFRCWNESTKENVWVDSLAYAQLYDFSYKYLNESLQEEGGVVVELEVSVKKVLPQNEKVSQ
jgi:hypothetical protein